MQELHKISLEGELWKPIPNTNNNYYISNYGRGLSLHTRKLMKFRSRDNKYLYLQYYDADGKQCYASVHRLVAKAFIGLPIDKLHLSIDALDINHINGNKHDNRTDNLEWVTHKENILHAYVTGLIPRQLRSVLCVELNKVYATMSDASRDLGVARQNIWRVCNGITKTTGGYTFRYLEGEK